MTLVLAHNLPPRTGWAGAVEPGRSSGSSRWTAARSAVPADDIPSPFNAFQTMHIDPVTNELGILPGRSRPGDYVEFRAETRCLCALSACPCGGTASRVEVWSQ